MPRQCKRSRLDPHSMHLLLWKANTWHRCPVTLAGLMEGETISKGSGSISSPFQKSTSVPILKVVQNGLQRAHSGGINFIPFQYRCGDSRKNIQQGWEKGQQTQRRVKGETGDELQMNRDLGVKEGAVFSTGIVKFRSRNN